MLGPVTDHCGDPQPPTPIHLCPHTVAHICFATSAIFVTKYDNPGQDKSTCNDQRDEDFEWETDCQHLRSCAAQTEPPAHPPPKYVVLGGAGLLDCWGPDDVSTHNTGRRHCGNTTKREREGCVPEVQSSCARVSPGEIKRNQRRWGGGDT